MIKELKKEKLDLLKKTREQVNKIIKDKINEDIVEK